MDAGATLQVNELDLPRLRRTPRIADAAASHVGTISIIIVAIPLLVLTAATVFACWNALILHQDLDEGEPLIYGLAQRILQHAQLYQPIDRQPFVQVHYTPLYYYAIAALRKFSSVGFGPGRTLSLMAGVITAGALAIISARESRSWAAGGFAALLFFGPGMPGGPVPFLALVRVDMLGVAFSVAAIAVLFFGTSWKHVLAAGTLAALALLTKQSLFAAALAGCLWLALSNLRKASIFGVTAAAVTLIPALLLQWSSGGAFWHNVGPDNPDPTSLEFGASLFRELLVLQGIPTLLALYFVIRERAWRQPATRLLMIYWFATMLPVLGIIKIGANHNYWIELAAINAVLATLAVRTCLRPESRRLLSAASMAPVIVLGVQLAVLTPARFFSEWSHDPVPENWTLPIAYFANLRNETGEFDQLVQNLTGEKVVLAESMDMAVLSDHPVRFEPFAFSMLEAQGRWDSTPLVDSICSGEITMLVLSYPVELDVYPVGGTEFPMWPRSVVTALRDTMKFEQIRDAHWLYRPPAYVDLAAFTKCQRDAEAARHGG